jgi:hypothetical protein
LKTLGNVYLEGKKTVMTRFKNLGEMCLLGGKKTVLFADLFNFFTEKIESLRDLKIAVQFLNLRTKNAGAVRILRSKIRIPTGFQNYCVILKLDSPQTPNGSGGKT